MNGRAPFLLRTVAWAMMLPVGLWVFAPLRHTPVVALLLIAGAFLLGYSGFCLEMAKRHRRHGGDQSAWIVPWTLLMDDLDPEGHAWLRRYRISLTLFVIAWVGGFMVVQPFAR